MSATKSRAKKVRPPRVRKPKQQYIPGFEPPSVPAVDDAADTYTEARDERQKLSKEEKQAKVSLIEKMREANMDRYETPGGLIVSLLNDTDVKVAVKKEPKKKRGKGNVESNGEGGEE